MYEIAGPNKVKPTMSRVYPERKWIKEKRYQAWKRNINRLKQRSILSRSIAKRKLDIRGSGEQENAPERKIQKTD
jgi:hypothetical protein